MAILLSDTFTDTDSTALDDHTMDVGSGWVHFGDALTNLPDADNMYIQSAKALTNGSNIYKVYGADAGQADVVFTVDVTLPNTTNYLAWVSFRVTDRLNWFAAAIERDGGGTPYLQIYEYATGLSARGTPDNMPGATNSTVTLTVTCNGTSLDVQASTGESTSYSSSNNLSATYFGLITYVDGTYTVSGQYDNFLVHTAGAAGSPWYYYSQQ